MTTENQGFDAGEFYDEGVNDAGMNESDAVTDSPQQDDSLVMTQESSQPETQAEQAETASQQQQEEVVDDKNKAADSSGSDEVIQAALQSTEEEAQAQQQVESVIGDLLPKVEDVEKAQDQQRQAEHQVPLEAHTKLRERAQKAEQERDELRRKLEATSTGGESPGIAEKSPLDKYLEEHADEELLMSDIPAKVQIAESRFHEAKREAQAEAQRRQEEQVHQQQAEKQNRINTINAIQQKAVNSEVEFRKSHPDYDAVTRPFVKARLLSQEERVEFLRAANPAQKLYEICKVKAEALGINTTPKSETPKEESKPTAKAPASTTAKTKPQDRAEEELTDDEIFDLAFPDKHSPQDD